MKNTIYSMAYGVAIVSAIFAIVLAVLIGANTYQLATAHALNSPELAGLIEKSQQNPADEALKTTIRALDRKARFVFFSSERFNRNASVMLAAAVVVMLISLKTITTIRRIIPQPAKSEAAAGGDLDDLSVARWLLGVVAISLMGLGLYLAWKPRQNETPVVAVVQPVEKINSTFAQEFFPSLDELKKNWPGFRGIDGLGVAYCSNAPTAWDGKSGKGIVWKTAIPKPGANSPVIWGDKVFLSGANNTGRSIYCVNRTNGTMIWDQSVPVAKSGQADPGNVSEDTGLAASTMATDGKRVFAMFPNGDMTSLDMNGKQQWLINIGKPDNSYGFASSPVCFEGYVIVQFDQKTGGRVLAVDAKDGHIVWDRQRDVKPSWASPIIVRRPLSTQVVLAAEKILAAYDCYSGEEQWSVDCLSGEVAPSPAYWDGIIYAGQDRSVLAAVDSDKKKLIWKAEENLPEVASPLATRGFVITALTDSCKVACFDAKSGRLLWTHEFESAFYSSPVAAGEFVYATDRTGVTHIFKASAEWKEAGKCELGEGVDATLAIVDDKIYIRGKTTLFCIGSI